MSGSGSSGIARGSADTQASQHVERVYAAAGASHNFPYEDPDFVIGVVRRVLAEHPPGNH